MSDPQTRSLSGRCALVTGASRGIGSAIARRLAGQGADLVLSSRGLEGLTRLAAELQPLGTQVHVVACDLTDRSSLDRLMGVVGERFGRLDILINNAGVLPPATLAEDIDWTAWDATIGLNLNAPWYLAGRAKKLMSAGNGVIVNNSSTAAYYPSRGLAAYNVSKSALVMLTRVLALEWARDGIRVLGVAPGKIDTELVQPVLRWAERTKSELNPLGRLGSDTEVADLVAFLVSDHARYLTGVTIAIDGGELLGTAQ